MDRFYLTGKLASRILRSATHQQKQTGETIETKNSEFVNIKVYNLSMLYQQSRASGQFVKQM